MSWALKTTVGRPVTGALLASQPTMTRFEKASLRLTSTRCLTSSVTTFSTAFPFSRAPFFGDMDPTAIRTYVQQELALFNSHFGGYRLMALHIYEGQSGKLIATVIRPGKNPEKDKIISLLERLVTRILARFPSTALTLRAE